MGYIAFNANTVTAQENGLITGRILNLHSTNINANGLGSSITSTSIVSVFQNTWYTIYSYPANFKIILFMLLLGFENNDGDAQNLSSFFTSPATNAYSSAPTQSAIRVSGSPLLEVQITVGNQLQIRTTSAFATGSSNDVLHFTLINHLGT